MNTEKTIRFLRIFGRELLLQASDPCTVALETDLLLAEGLGKDRVFLELYPDLAVESPVAERFLSNLQRRAAGCPVAYLLGHREFMGYDFEVSDKVLIPRSDTEAVIELASEALEKIGRSAASGSRMGLEIGVGTGIISLLLLARFPQLVMEGIDINEHAVALSIRNAEYLERQFLGKNGEGIAKRYRAYAADIFEPEGLEKKAFDFIISNPPYIESAEIKRLAVDVKDYEPIAALDGGADGLDFYRRICEQLPELVKAGGFVAFEIGYDQADRLKKLFEAAGLSDIETRKDLAGHDRAIIGYKK